MTYGARLMLMRILITLGIIGLGSWLLVDGDVVWWHFILLGLGVRWAISHMIGPWVSEGRQVEGADYDD